MNGLYPIIRRIRRPLLTVDLPAQTKPVETSRTNESKPTGTKVAPEVASEQKADASDTNK